MKKELKKAIQQRKRKYERASALVLLDVDSLGEQEKSGRAVIVDISVGGVAFESVTEFSVGEDVILRYIMPGHDVYVLGGVIKRVEDRGVVYAYGVEFALMSFFEKRKLKKLISKIGKKQ